MAVAAGVSALVVFLHHAFLLGKLAEHFPDGNEPPKLKGCHNVSKTTGLAVAIVTLAVWAGSMVGRFEEDRGYIAVGTGAAIVAGAAPVVVVVGLVLIAKRTRGQRLSEMRPLRRPPPPRGLPADAPGSRTVELTFRASEDESTLQTQEPDPEAVVNDEVQITFRGSDEVEDEVDAQAVLEAPLPAEGMERLASAEELETVSSAAKAKGVADTTGAAVSTDAGATATATTTVLHSYLGDPSQSQLSVDSGDIVQLVREAGEWSWVRARDESEGYVPSAYLTSQPEP